MNGQDYEHVRLLGIFHYVLGGIQGLFACFPIFHVVMGIVFVTQGFPGPQDVNGPPPFFGWLFIIIGSIGIVLGWTIATLLLVAAGRLRKHRSYTFCFVVACIECIVIPLGTVLGIFSIIVLSRPSVKAMFQPR
ncbi:MAG: hypothetical protein LLG01_12895 [Planctomycetaceae bacterium]|nr:hypothetical protein [Planctomycetaceae bacterium]